MSETMSDKTPFDLDAWLAEQERQMRSEEQPGPVRPKRPAFGSFHFCPIHTDTPLQVYKGLPYCPECK